MYKTKLLALRTVWLVACYQKLEPLSHLACFSSKPNLYSGKEYTQAKIQIFLVTQSKICGRFLLKVSVLRSENEAKQRQSQTFKMAEHNDNWQQNLQDILAETEANITNLKVEKFICRKGYLLVPVK